MPRSPRTRRSREPREARRKQNGRGREFNLAAVVLVRCFLFHPAARKGGKSSRRDDAAETPVRLIYALVNLAAAGRVAVARENNNEARFAKKGGWLIDGHGEGEGDEEDSLSNFPRVGVSTVPVLRIFKILSKSAESIAFLSFQWETE